MTQPAIKKPITCTVNVKNEETLTLQPCGAILNSKGALCPNRAQHCEVRTGFCENGNCEGTNRKSFRGNPQPTCKFWKTCSCSCHLSYDQMFKMSEMERTLIDNSGYSPDRGGFVMPTMEERMAALALSAPVEAPRTAYTESAAPDIVPPSIVRDFGPTATGRAAAGELESWVKKQCDIWLIESQEEGDWYTCTPAYLSEKIAEDEGIKPPSVGAISAVFDRWIKIGFADCQKKPTRFVAYTEQGIKLGLEGCKEKFKRNKRSAEAQAGRRIGR